MKTTSAALSLVLAVSASAAFAGDAGAFYLGGSIGQSMYDYSSNKCTTLAQNASGDPLASCTTDKNDTGFKLLAGYNFTPMVALEASYANLGELQATVNVPSQSLSGNLNQTSTAFGLDVVGNWPLGNGFTISGKVGGYAANSTSKNNFGTNDSTANTTGLNYGLRGSYAFDTNWSGQIEWERYSNVGKDDANANSNNSPTLRSNIDLASVGLVYNF